MVFSPYAHINNICVSHYPRSIATASWLRSASLYLTSNIRKSKVLNLVNIDLSSQFLQENEGYLSVRDSMRLALSYLYFELVNVNLSSHFFT